MYFFSLSELVRLSNFIWLICVILVCLHLLSIFTDLFINSPIYLFIYLFIHSFIHYLFIYLFTAIWVTNESK